VGREKINQMCSQFNDDEVADVNSRSAPFDPDGLLNPWQEISLTLTAAPEFGAHAYS